ncbi:MAG TPA: SAF domain-containing protein [Chloroflexota bacterium]|nr:SAF domain-containing protein [Chloroflexota bacterium]
MNKKQLGSLLIGVGGLLAIIIGVVVYLQLTSAQEKLAQVPTERVVVATRDIPDQGRIELRAVDIASVTKEAMPNRPITRVEDAVGKFARQRIYKGDVLNADRVVDLKTIRDDLSAGKSVPSVSLVLDRDQVLFVFPSRLQGSFAGQGPNSLTAADAIKAGDYVDILATTLEFPDGMTPEQRQAAQQDRLAEFLRTRVLFQNLRVYNVGVFQSPDAKTDQAANRPEDRWISFIVDRDTALQLKWLKDLVALGQANVDFVLRSPSNPDVQPAAPITVQDMQRQYGLYGRQ